MPHDEPALKRSPRPPQPNPVLRYIAEHRRYFAFGGVALLAVVVLAILVIPGPGPDPGDDVADPNWLNDDPDGEVVYCSGEDVSRSQARSVKDFNRSSVSGSARAELVDDIVGKADGQRAEYLKRVSAGACDVLYLDIIYTPEFADKELLYDMTSYLDSRGGAGSFDPQMMRTVELEEKRWGVPKQLDGGVIYYREDKASAPRTWQQLLRLAVPEPGEFPRLRFQLDAYEGLTVVFLELARAAGAESIVSEDGKTANIDQTAMLDALEFLREAIRRRAVPRSVFLQGDRGSLEVFELGRAAFLRGWPYIETRIPFDAETTPNPDAARARRNTAENLGVDSLPPWEVGGRRVGILGGHNLVIPRSARNPQAALRLIDFLTSEEQILRDARDASLAPVLSDLWDHPDVRASAALMAVHDEDLLLRPVIPRYARVSRVIYTALRRVLKNEQAVKTFPRELREIEADVQEVLDE